MKERKKDCRFSVEKLNSRIYHHGVGSNHILEDHEAEIKTENRDQIAESNMKFKTDQSESLEMHNLQVKVTSIEPTKEKKRLPKIRKTVNLFKQQKKQFESECLEREKELSLMIGFQ